MSTELAQDADASQPNMDTSEPMSFDELIKRVLPKNLSNPLRQKIGEVHQRFCKDVAELKRVNRMIDKHDNDINTLRGGKRPAGIPEFCMKYKNAHLADVLH